LEVDSIKKSQPRKIEISAVHTKSGRVMLRVADNGIGISPANLRKIFEPFFTTKSEQTDGLGGSGLGLSICHEIMKSMGGNISVESTPDQGTSFSLDLPMAA